MKKILVVCDTCENPDKETKTYRIVSEGRTKELDLCADDGAPIEKFLEGTRARGGVRAAGTGTRGRRAGAGRTTSLEEINAAKDASKKEPANA